MSSKDAPFSRFSPFDDKREIIIRRGKEMGRTYGLEMGRRQVTVKGQSYDLVNFRVILSPPSLEPGGSPDLSHLKNYQPEFEVLFLEDAEVLIPRAPNGFSAQEIEHILQKIQIV